MAQLADRFARCSRQQELGSPDGAEKANCCLRRFSHTLYEGAYILGASFHGPGSTPTGVAELKAWAKDVPALCEYRSLTAVAARWEALPKPETGV